MYALVLLFACGAGCGDPVSLQVNQYANLNDCRTYGNQWISTSANPTQALLGFQCTTTDSPKKQGNTLTSLATATALPSVATATFSQSSSSQPTTAAALAPAGSSPIPTTSPGAVTGPSTSLLSSGPTSLQAAAGASSSSTAMGQDIGTAASNSNVSFASDFPAAAGTEPITVASRQLSSQVAQRSLAMGTSQDLSTFNNSNTYVRQSEAVFASPQGSRPEITISSPENGAVLKTPQDLKISVSAKSASTIRSISISTDGILVKSCLTSSVCTAPDVSDIAAGTHAIAVTAIDEKGTTATADVLVTVVE